MSAFLVRRILLSLLTVWFASILIFLAIRLLPGDAVTAATDPTAGGATSKEQAAALRRELGLDDPYPVQYYDWISGLVQFDLGKSSFSGRPVSELVKQAVPVSLELAVMALGFAIVTGFAVGILGAVTRGTPVDYTTRLISTLGLTVPNFVLALAVLLIGVRQFDWIPPTRYVSLIKNPQSNLTQFIFPSLILAYAFSASIARMTRSSVLEVLSADYVRTARAKGLRQRAIILRHVIRNALVPIMTVVGIQMAALLGGSVIIESVFNLPGLGLLILNGVTNRDYPVIQAGVLVVSSFVILTNLLVDLSYGAIDPRVSLGGRAR